MKQFIFGNDKNEIYGVNSKGYKIVFSNTGIANAANEVTPTNKPHDHNMEVNYVKRKTSNGVKCHNSTTSTARLTSQSS